MSILTQPTIPEIIEKYLLENSWPDELQKLIDNKQITIDEIMNIMPLDKGYLTFTFSNLDIPLKWNIFDHAILRNKLVFAKGLYKNLSLTQKALNIIGLIFKSIINSITIIPTFFVYGFGLVSYGIASYIYK
jgi:hypothetical protein